MTDYLKKITNETVLNILERKQILSELARNRGKDTIQAISELNKMEQVYQTAPVLNAPMYFNYVLATRENAAQLAEGIRQRQEESNNAIQEPEGQNETTEGQESETP